MVAIYSILWEAANKLSDGMKLSRYKDFVLLFLFFKYISDKYKERYTNLKIRQGASFDDFILTKGNYMLGNVPIKSLKL